MKIKPDIFATIHFYETEKGGKKFPVTRQLREHFGCPITFQKSTKQGFDCRIYLDEVEIINPGETKNRLPIKFLCWDLVKPFLAIGTKFYLWEAGIIGEGIVEQIVADE